MHLVLHCDGASRGNPGPAALGFVIRRGPGGPVLAGRGEPLGPMTNNQAEWRAVLRALELASGYKPAKVTLVLDSELVVRQLRGQYKVRNPGLQPLHAQAMAALRALPSWEVLWVPRAQNADADRLANLALDAGRPVADA